MANDVENNKSRVSKSLRIAKLRKQKQKCRIKHERKKKNSNMRRLLKKSILARKANTKNTQVRKKIDNLLCNEQKIQLTGATTVNEVKIENNGNPLNKHYRGRRPAPKRRTNAKKLKEKRRKRELAMVSALNDYGIDQIAKIKMVSVKDIMFVFLLILIVFQCIYKLCFVTID